MSLLLLTTGHRVKCWESPSDGISAQPKGNLTLKTCPRGVTKCLTVYMTISKGHIRREIQKVRCQLSTIEVLRGVQRDSGFCNLVRAISEFDCSFHVKTCDGREQQSEQHHASSASSNVAAPYQTLTNGTSGASGNAAQPKRTRPGCNYPKQFFKNRRKGEKKEARRLARMKKQQQQQNLMITNLISDLKKTNH